MTRRSLRTRPGRAAHQDRGAALILVIALILMVGTISAGLAALVSSSLTDHGSLERSRNREYSADGAVEYAIAQVRAIAGSPLEACARPGDWFASTRNGTTTAMPVLNGIPIRVDWDNACGAVLGVDGSVVVQRNVVFAACADTGARCVPAAVVVRAQVNFEQLASGPVTATYVQTWSVNG